jgi:hypothetical protein
VRLGVAAPEASPQVAVAHAHAAPHLHWAPQEQTGFVAGVWHPQAQAVPGQVVQVQGLWFTSLMMRFPWWARRRDVIDAAIFGVSALC